MITVQDLCFRYPESDQDALSAINWQIAPGEFAILSGHSGSGKSTLLRCLNGLIPHFHGGFFEGHVSVFGRSTRDHLPRDLATVIGTVFQDPETQLLTDSTEEEIVFALENFGFDAPEIVRRLQRCLGELSIEHLRHRRLATLSGGERQMIALATAIAAEPPAIVFDEPTSQLDGVHARGIIEHLERLNRERGSTVIVSEHRLARLLPAADQLVQITDGQLSDAPESSRSAILTASGLLPEPGKDMPFMASETPGERLLSIEDLSYSYGEHQALQAITFDLHRGETIALTGPNGSGKTTLLKLIIGLLRPDQGRLMLMGRSTSTLSVPDLARSIGYVPQQPSLMLHQETVEAELQFTLRSLRRSGNVEETLSAVGLSGYQSRHPLDLSGGERQRLAIACIMIGEPEILLLDEPTRGLPWSAKRELASMLRAYAAPGKAIVIATHDEDFCRVFADRRVELSQGRLVADHSASRNPGAVRRTADNIQVLTGSNPD